MSESETNDDTAESCFGNFLEDWCAGVGVDAGQFRPFGAAAAMVAAFKQAGWILMPPVLPEDPALADALASILPPDEWGPIADRIRLAEHTWGEAVPARYAEAVASIEKAASRPGWTNLERLRQVRLVLTALASIDGHPGEDKR